MGLGAKLPAKLWAEVRSVMNALNEAINTEGEGSPRGTFRHMAAHLDWDAPALNGGGPCSVCGKTHDHMNPPNGVIMGRVPANAQAWGRAALELRDILTKPQTWEEHAATGGTSEEIDTARAHLKALLPNIARLVVLCPCWQDANRFYLFAEDATGSWLGVTRATADPNSDDEGHPVWHAPKPLMAPVPQGHPWAHVLFPVHFGADFTAQALGPEAQAQGPAQGPDPQLPPPPAQA